MTFISDGEVQVGINGLGFIGNSLSKYWIWDDIARGEVAPNGLAIALYDGPAAEFVLNYNMLNSDEAKLSQILGTLHASYRELGPDWDLYH